MVTFRLPGEDVLAARSAISEFRPVELLPALAWGGPSNELALGGGAAREHPPSAAALQATAAIRELTPLLIADVVLCPHSLVEVCLVDGTPIPAVDGACVAEVWACRPEKVRVRKGEHEFVVRMSDDQLRPRARRE